MHPVYFRWSYQIWRLCQQFQALLLLILLVPLFAVLYLAVRLTSAGPFLFFQARPGLGGKEFFICKIRTMTVGSEKNVHNGLAVTGQHPGVTTVGKILRELKIDELPQLWNIVRGDMEFVGPRPIAPVLYDKLCQSIPGFAMRCWVRPGLTNVGQVAIYDNECADKVVEDWRFRFEAEVHYLQHKSVTYDIVLVVLTGLFLLKKALKRVRWRDRSNPGIEHEAGNVLAKGSRIAS